MRASLARAFAERPWGYAARYGDTPAAERRERPHGRLTALAGGSVERRPRVPRGRQSDAEVVAVLEDASPAARENLREAAMERFSDEGVQVATEHALERFAELPEPNPARDEALRQRVRPRPAR